MTVIDWLLDADPSIRWQALRDLADAPADIVAAERARVADEGWGARILALQGEDGLWEGGALFPARDGEPLPWSRDDGQPWTATAYCLVYLQDFGIDPTDARVRRAVELVTANARWENDNQPYFEGETEPCINGMVVAQGAYFGVDVDSVVDRLVGEQLEDGGWNCEVENGSVRGSFHTTIRVLEGLLLHEQATGGSAAATSPRRRGRGLPPGAQPDASRSRTGEVIDPAFLEFAFPTRWHYDVLRGLDYFRSTGAPPDPRPEAIELVRSKRRPRRHVAPRPHLEGRRPVPDGGRDGSPSRWNTLRALRVLRWADVSAAS